MARETKIKILWYSEIFANTGFSNVTENLIQQLLKTGRYEIDVVGLHYFGEPYDHSRWPITIYPSYTPALSHISVYDDKLGRQRTIDLLAQGDYDIFFTLSDTFNIATFGKTVKELQEKKSFKWVSYSPLDWEPEKRWIEEGIALADVPVLYTETALAEAKKILPKLKAQVIYHGIDLNSFHLVSKPERDAFRLALLGEANKDKFLVTNINRNQPRKDIPRTIAAFAKFHETVKDSILYLHMQAHETGGDLISVVEHFKIGDSVIFPNQFKWDFGYPVALMNLIYNATDLLVTTTMGEGWGLSLTEAMATKTPIVAPANTSIPEILGLGSRGWLVDNVNPADYWVIHSQNDLSRITPIVSVNEFAAKLEMVHGLIQHNASINAQVNLAYKWVQGLSWEKISKQWDDLFQKTAR